MKSAKKKSSMKSIITILTLLCGSMPCLADVAYGSKEILLDNDTVEVVRLTYPVGTQSGMHKHIHPNRAVYFVKGGELTLMSADKNKENKVLTIPDGKTLFLPATTHNVVNSGNREIIIIETEIKAH
jgi:mannose-6-phosphate isomerase-like protein (cupin superfamily)